MPITKEWKEGGLYRSFSADTTARDIIESNLESHGDQRFDDIHYVLNDFSLIENFDLDVEDINIIVSLDQAAALTKKALKIAVVATNPDLVSWFRLYVEKLSEKTPYQSRLFVLVEDAKAWCMENDY